MPWDSISSVVLSQRLVTVGVDFGFGTVWCGACEQGGLRLQLGAVKVV